MATCNRATSVALLKELLAHLSGVGDPEEDEEAAGRASRQPTIDQGRAERAGEGDDVRDGGEGDGVPGRAFQPGAPRPDAVGEARAGGCFPQRIAGAGRVPRSRGDAQGAALQVEGVADHEDPALRARLQLLCLEAYVRAAPAHRLAALGGLVEARRQRTPRWRGTGVPRERRRRIVPRRCSAARTAHSVR